MRVTVLIVRQEREKAVQVICAECLPFLWLPRSQIETELHAGDRDVVIEVPDWLWNQKINPREN